MCSDDINNAFGEAANPVSRRHALKLGLLIAAGLNRSPAQAEAVRSKTIETSSTKLYQLLPNMWGVSGSELTHKFDGNAYLVKSDDELILLDCGSTLGYQALKKNLAALGLPPSQLKHVFATHCHWDHISGFSPLSKESNAKLYIHKDDAGAVKNGDYDLTATFLYGRDLEFPKMTPNVVLLGGETFKFGNAIIEVLHTPGHTPGSVCFGATVDGKRILVAGDTLWGGCHSRIGSNLEDWKRSLDRLCSEDFDYLTWGHYQPMLFGDTKARLAEAREQFDVYLNPWFKPFDKKFIY